MAGSGDFENAEIFALVDVVEDMWMKMIHIFIEKDEKRKVKGARGGAMVREDGGKGGEIEGVNFTHTHTHTHTHTQG